LNWDGDGQTLESLLSVSTLRDLDAALAPRRRVERSLVELQTQLRECRTRAECEATFAVWLDGGELLVDEDEIEWM
jgi:hypothetical protein